MFRIANKRYWIMYQKELCTYYMRIQDETERNYYLVIPDTVMKHLMYIIPSIMNNCIDKFREDFEGPGNLIIVNLGTVFAVNFCDTFNQDISSLMTTDEFELFYRNIKVYVR